MGAKIKTLWPSNSGSKWNFEFGFWGKRKTKVAGEKSLGRTNNKLNPHITPRPGIEPGSHWWEKSALTTAHPRSPNQTQLGELWERGLGELWERGLGELWGSGLGFFSLHDFFFANCLCKIFCRRMNFLFFFFFFCLIFFAGIFLAPSPNHISNGPSLRPSCWIIEYSYSIIQHATEGRHSAFN